ncbi:DUF3761 domain-containing protein [Mycobacterium simiae]
MFRAFVGAAAVAAIIGLSGTGGAYLVDRLGELPRSPVPLSQCPPGYYTNSSGNRVESPDQNPSNATAVCCDGSTSHSQHRSGTCSRPPTPETKPATLAMGSQSNS